MSDGTASGTWVATSSFIVNSDFAANGILTRTGTDTYAASTTISVGPFGGTGATTLTRYGALYGNGSGAIQATAAGTGGYILMANGANAAPAWVATTSFIMDADFAANGILTRTAAGTYVASSTIQVAYGGTGSTTLTGILKGNGTNGIVTALSGTDYLPGAAISAGAAIGNLAYYTSTGQTIDDIANGAAGTILMSVGAAAPTWVSTSTFIVDADFAANGILTRTGSGASPLPPPFRWLTAAPARLPSLPTVYYMAAAPIQSAPPAKAPTAIFSRPTLPASRSGFRHHFRH